MKTSILHSLAAALLLALCIPFVSCTPQTDEREEALNFLYSYMPLPDSTDYSRDFWLMNVDYALRAKEEMGWNVPEREWKHFVLPVRVNNENLDEARRVFYEELKPRIQGLGMKEAILEVNHWCHEKVTYQPSDARTRSPLATVQAGIGRCGEESTFTVAALRAVGIPARQVYTPRWAHTDDNHAWVEAWADGQWYFLGACEPEPILNLGWFNSAASRGMLMHTNVFGDYQGDERVIQRNRCYTEIAVTDNYAPTAEFTVNTFDKNGQLTPALVEYKIYNYAEFHTVATVESEGQTTFRAGLGDMLVWASNGTDYGYVKCSVGKQDTVNITLDSPTAQWLTEIVPPQEDTNRPQPTEEQLAANKLRLAQEDSIRNSTPHGNDAVLNAFKAEATDPALAQQVIDLLSVKDRGDVTMEVLTDCYNHSCGTMPDLLAQRVANEGLTPYKAFLGSVLPQGLTIEQWAQWVQDSIRICEESNPRALCMSPISVWKHRVTDRHSRDIFFIAGARSIGLPARYDAVTGRPVPDLLDSQTEDAPKATGMLKLTPQGETERNASYYSHFSLSRIVDGRLQLMEFPESYTAQNFAQGVTMPQGRYVLVTGTRLANGSVLVQTDFFELKDEATLPLQLRQDTEQLSVIGSLNCEALYTDADDKQQSILSTVGRGYYILVVTQQTHEPSNHILHDIALKRAELDAMGHSMLMLDGAQNPEIVALLAEGLHLPNRDLPIVVIADSFNRIVWARQGYSIGMGEQLLNALKKL